MPRIIYGTYSHKGTNKNQGGGPKKMGGATNDWQSTPRTGSARAIG